LVVQTSDPPNKQSEIHDLAVYSRECLTPTTLALCRSSHLSARALCRSNHTKPGPTRTQKRTMHHRRGANAAKSPAAPSPRAVEPATPSPCSFARYVTARLRCLLDGARAAAAPTTSTDRPIDCSGRRRRRLRSHTQALARTHLPLTG
jgi:hypothetical protein